MGDTIKDLLHAFLYGKKLLVETGELAEASRIRATTTESNLPEDRSR